MKFFIIIIIIDVRIVDVNEGYHINLFVIESSLKNVKKKLYKTNVMFSF